MPHEKNSFSASETGAGNDAWTIDGTPERAAEAIQRMAGRLAEMGWDEEQIGRMEEGVSVGIGNTLRYGNAGDASKRISVEISVARDPGGAETLEIAIAGASGRAEEGKPPVPDAEEATAHGDRMGELFLRLPAGTDVEFFPEENRIVLKQKRVGAVS